MIQSGYCNLVKNITKNLIGVKLNSVRINVKNISTLPQTIQEYPFSLELFARELDLYVVPKHRKGTAGMFMMKKFIDWAKANKALEVVFEPRLSDKHIKKFDAMAKRLGMSHFANAYRRKL